MADNTVFTAAASDIFDALSATARYNPATGTAATVRAILDETVAFNGNALPTAERQTVISILQEDWPANPVAGDTITLDSVVYTVLGLADADSDDDIEWRVRVRANKSE